MLEILVPASLLAHLGTCSGVWGSLGMMMRGVREEGGGGGLVSGSGSLLDYVPQVGR